MSKPTTKPIRPSQDPTETIAYLESRLAVLKAEAADAAASFAPKVAAANAAGLASQVVPGPNGALPALRIDH
jgi:hypothetical protein